MFILCGLVGYCLLNCVKYVCMFTQKTEIILLLYVFMFVVIFQESSKKKDLSGEETHSKVGPIKQCLQVIVEHLLCTLHEFLLTYPYLVVTQPLQTYIDSTIQ